MTHAVVIGGAGFAGSHLVEALLGDGWSVHVLDDLSTGRLSFLPHHDRLQFSQGDICRPGDFTRLRAGAAPDVVYHLAAVHHIPMCERAPAKALEVNIAGFQHVLDYATSAGARRVVFASSGAVYDASYHAGREGALTETAPLRANDVYATSKITGEFLLQRMCASANIEGVVARLFNIVGPRETNAHLIPDLLAQLRRGVNSVKVGNLFPRRDFIHVADVADALALLGRCSLRHRTEAFNVGSGVEYSVAEVVDELARAASVQLSVTTDPSRQRRQDRMRQLADITKLSQHTGWAPRLTLQDALAQMWSESQQAA